MKFYNKVLLTGFLLTILTSALGFTANSENISDKLIRMHVLANSDSEYDQRIKIEVKDDVTAFTEQIINSATSLEEAEQSLASQIKEISNVARNTLKMYHVDYDAQVVIEEKYFGTREYENFTLPAGDYLALSVLLGDAQGENWWCVVYPSLCVGSSISSEEVDVFNEEEEDLITQPNEISFKIHEIYMDIKNYFNSI